ncbi:hypothetical protein Bealeia1_01480 [Candidatus Bealeia paramacronuclearis]|uniref:Polymer-forming cytoskeletal protein n=1 Tax=Candidatus Bealeia paramacronuclearis TaxID=1921001 RepID=A0ABZ2C4A7_9PROT|nr:hypothetical protein [Candidatus Bealeia paramacronuclearis]
MHFSYFSFITLVALVSPLNATDLTPARLTPKVFYGPTNLSHKTHSDLTIHGPSDLDTLNVNGKLEVTGPLTAKGLKASHLKVTGPLSLKASDIGDATVHGPVELKTITAKGAFTVYGPLVSEGSRFLNSLIAYTNKVELINSHIRGITIVFQNKQSGSFGFDVGDSISVTIQGTIYDLKNLKKTEPILYVDSKSTIAGNVVFQGRQGLLVLGRGATFNGKVINGAVVWANQ